ncbi:hypothetical protein AKJ45_02210 [candidate division MSBL1 archaeon SCGC-AAA261F19]|uniref:Ribbon-helix-helix protein CopG domain-containing protein n=1 Tax=candidate division MSBL1 archaeon SCGC-AAA261F19 TaxID=1698275 RepID=A0A133V9U1_9EURY|nr:hypothetical protein AKJ45_02210 [candidate division MSBL1 archaeon SCGC-AAA261F19]
MGVLSLRVSDRVNKRIEEFAKREKLKKSEALRKILEKGLKELELERAIKLYREGEVTLWKAAEIADVPIWEMMRIVRENKIPLKYTVGDAKADLERVFG